MLAIFSAAVPMGNQSIDRVSRLSRCKGCAFVVARECDEEILKLVRFEGNRGKFSLNEVERMFIDKFKASINCQKC